MSNNKATQIEIPQMGSSNNTGQRESALADPPESSERQAQTPPSAASESPCSAGPPDGRNNENEQDQEPESPASAEPPEERKSEANAQPESGGIKNIDALALIFDNKFRDPQIGKKVVSLVKRMILLGVLSPSDIFDEITGMRTFGTAAKEDVRKQLIDMGFDKELESCLEDAKQKDQNNKTFIMVLNIIFCLAMTIGWCFFDWTMGVTYFMSLLAWFIPVWLKVRVREHFRPAYWAGALMMLLGLAATVLIIYGQVNVFRDKQEELANACQSIFVDIAKTEEGRFLLEGKCQEILELSGNKHEQSLNIASNSFQTFMFLLGFAVSWRLIR